MKRLLGGLIALALLAALVVLPWLALDSTPAIEAGASMRRSDLADVKSLFLKHDPRRQTPDMIHSLRLDEAELNRLLNYAVELRRITGISAELAPGLATLTATFAVPANPFGRYLNVSAEVAEAPDGIRIRSLQLGSLPLPGALADWLARRLHAVLRRDDAYAAMAGAFSRIRFEEGEATLDYRWTPDLLARMERRSIELLIPAHEQARMLAYAEQLKALLKRHPQGSTVPLVGVMAPLFEQARLSGGDPRIENRAALSALAAYLGGISLPRLFSGTHRSIHRAPPVLLSLHGRRDFAEHFTISAALSINGGSRLANAIGLFKEEEDAGKGSGFSFTDLAANRAGVRLGELATGDSAARVQQQLAQARADADLLPDFRQLPEFMSQAEFDRRFGPVGSPRYQALIEHIDRQLAAHPLGQ